MSVLVRIISYKWSKLTFIHLGRKRMFQAIRSLSELRTREPGLARNKCQCKILLKEEWAWNNVPDIVMSITLLCWHCHTKVSVAFTHNLQANQSQNHRWEYLIAHVLAAKEVGKRNFCLSVSTAERQGQLPTDQESSKRGSLCHH